MKKIQTNILRLLVDGDWMTSRQLADVLPHSAKKVARHLRILRSEGLVISSKSTMINNCREGKLTWYASRNIVSDASLYSKNGINLLESD